MAQRASPPPGATMKQAIVTVYVGVLLFCGPGALAGGDWFAEHQVDLQRVVEG